MLRTRLLVAFAGLILVVGLLSLLFGIQAINARIVSEAQNRVRLDLGSAWSVYGNRLEQTETILRLAATKKMVTEACAAGAWDQQELRERLEAIRDDFGMDFMTLADHEGRVRLRTVLPHATGDSMARQALVRQAINGEIASGTVVMPGSDLDREAAGLAERAFIELEATPKARPTPRKVEDRGLVMMAAVPVFSGARVTAVLYAGVLLNRHAVLADHICDAVYTAPGADPRPPGTVTIFLNDNRVATTVRKANGNRALGTRVSREVAERVLDNGQPWIDKAFVVDDWYLTAYDPIRDPAGQVVGMLYVGIPDAPFQELAASIIGRYALIMLGAGAASMVLAFLLANRLARPIHRLVLASDDLRHGRRVEPLPVDKTASEETGHLTKAFNGMAAALQERERSLHAANQSLQAVNSSYMETLGFVTHELNTPIGSMMNYAYLMKSGRIGELSEKQTKAVAVIDDNLHRIAEMVRHYLQLSRIEQGRMDPMITDFSLGEKAVQPVIDSLAPRMAEKGMTAENLVPADLVLSADPAMIREVLENLVSNALKYGREGGMITVAAEAVAEGMRCRVRNEGDGIQPEERDRLFRKFSRLAPGKGGSLPKGTGLGLFIIKNIVEAHGGTVGIESEPGQWAEFSFTLPRADDQPPS